MIERDASLARTLRVGKADTAVHETSADLDVAAERRDVLSIRNADTTACAMVRIGYDIHIELARRRSNVGVDIYAPRRLQGQRHIAARRLGDGVLHSQFVIVVAACRLHRRRRAAVQGVFDALHVDERVRRRFTARKVSDDDITGIDQPFAALARF